MLSTPRSDTSTLSAVTEHQPTQSAPSTRRPAFIFVTVVALLVAGAVIWATSAEDKVPQANPAPAVSPSPQLRPAAVGEPFDLGHWRITVTSIRCGTAHELLAQNASNGQEPTDRVCLAAISYTNVDKVPHLFGGTVDEQVPEEIYTGQAADGARYDGHSWLQEATNPGLSQTSELIFKVPAGVTLAAVEIGDVRVTA